MSLKGDQLEILLSVYVTPPPPTPEIALNVPDNVSAMTCSYIFAC